MGAESDEADTTGKRLKGVRCEKRSEQRVMRRYSVLGISLMDFSAREGLRRAEHFLQTGHSIQQVILTRSLCPWRPGMNRSRSIWKRRI